MADVDAPERIVAACDERFGVVHGLVNVAALTDRSTVWTATPEHWDQMMAINVRAPFFVLQARRRGDAARGRPRLDRQHRIGVRARRPAGSSRTACRRVRWRS